VRGRPAQRHVECSRVADADGESGRLAVAGRVILAGKNEPVG
jgi:hypothetical protein